MPDLSQCLAQYTAGLTFDQIPQEVIAQAKLRVLDSLGCAVAAFDADTSQVARRVARELGGNPQAEGGEY